MRSTTQRLQWVMIALAVTALAVAAGAGAQAPEPGPFDRTPVVPELAVAGVEVLGGEIVATFAVMAREAQTDVQIQLELPEGLTVAAGQPSWRGEMAAGQVQVVEISAKLMKPGRQRIVGRVTLSSSSPSPTVLTTDRWVDVKPSFPSRPRK